MLLPLAVAMQDGSAGELVLQDRECEKIDEPPVRYIVDKMPISNVLFLEYLLHVHSIMCVDLKNIFQTLDKYVTVVLFVFQNLCEHKHS